MRPWLAMKNCGIPFSERLSRFDDSTEPLHKHFWEFSPSKKVPVLQHEEHTIWDSLAILEYLHELYPEKELWPRDRDLRAHARAVTSEMHSGFLALRDECPMNMARNPGRINISKDAKFDIERIENLWDDCFEKYGGPFLFGEFSIADAFYAPVVNRTEIYKLSEHPAALHFSEAIRSLAAWKEWEEAGRAEPWICEIAEI